MRPPTTRWPVLLLAAATAGCLSLFSSDPAAPRGRGARFDRFADELHLALVDTAGLIEGVRLRGARTAEDPPVVEAPVARRGVGFIQGDEERREARRVAVVAALRRLSGEFAPGRFGDEGRSAAARAIGRDLRRTLGLGDEPTATQLASARVRTVAPSPWSGVPFAVAATLSGELAADSRADLDRWKELLEALPAAIRAAADGLTAEALDEAHGLRAPVVVRALMDDMARQRPAIGTGRRADPLLGPYVAARQRVLGESAMEAMGAIPAELRRGLGDAFGRYDDALRAVHAELGQERRAQTVVPLEGERRERWLRALTDAAGERATPDGLDGLARAEIERLTAEVGAVLGVDAPDDVDAVRAEFDAIRSGRRRLERGARGTRLEALFAAEQEALDTLIDMDGGPTILLATRPAAPHERPRGRWSPFVPGDLRLPPRGRETPELPARPGVYLAPRSGDALAPSWLREADALRHGPAGHGLVDAFRRAARSRPLYLRARPDPVLAEGWSLYALAELDAAGRHPEAASRFGLLAQELIAFAALAVDVGLHERGWSVDQATVTVQEMTPLGRLPARELVLRAITFPGREALPAVGLLRLRSLRREASTRLGERFDARAFHRAVLEGGPAPMDEVDRRVERWLKEVGDE